MADDPLRTADRTRTAPPGPPRAAADGPLTELAAPGITGYDLQAEIGRGGMGVVYAAHDRAVGREVAVKTLIPGRPFDAETAARFDTESRVTARLQHPAVPPVFALGRFPDGRPYMVMKRVHGRTLAALLKERPSPAHGVTRVVAAFEQVCHAVGFAHARGVVHRDLKPSNVMIGEFGEVQVMDWGLAKQMPQAPAVGRGWVEDSTEHMPAVPAATAVPAAPPAPDTDVTQAGRPLGTPAYMAPEQARGEWDRVGPWSDVFALGGVLADILTGKPPFVADTAFNALVLAGTGNVADAFARLDASGADPALVALCKRCLAPEPQHRPANGKELADAVAAYRAGVDARLRKSEAEKAAAAAREQEAVHRAAAEAQAAEAAKKHAAEAERRARAEEANAAAQKAKRRTQLLLVAAVALLLLGGLGFAWWQDARSTRAAAEKKAAAAKAEAEKAADYARDGDAARAALKLAAELRTQRRFREANEALSQADKLAVGQDDLSGEVKKAKADTAFARDLDAVRARKWAWTPNLSGDGGKFDPSGAPAEYAKAFAARGFNFNAGTDANALANRVKESAVRADVLRALDDWALFADPKDAAVEKVLEVAFRATPTNDPAARLRDPKVRRDDGQLVPLLKDVPAVSESPAAAVMAAALASRRPAASPGVILTVAQARYPLDFDVTFDLAFGHHLEAVRAVEKNPAQAEQLMRTAVGHYRTARALRPDHPTVLTNLGMLLNMLNEPAAAIPVLREAVKHHPSDSVAHFNLGCALLATNDLDGAETALRKTIELSGNYALAHFQLGNVLQRLRRPREAAEQFQQAAKLAPNDPTVQSNFAILVANSGKPDDALGILAKVLAAHPKFALAHYGRGVALRHKKDEDGWRAEFREAMALDPKQFNHLAKELGEEPKKGEPKKDELEPKK